MGDYDGKVTADENPLKNQKEPSGLFPTDLSLDRLDDSNDDFKDHKDEMGDEEKDNFDEKMAKASAMNVPSWPSKIYAYVKLGYDNSLAAQMTKHNNICCMGRFSYDSCSNTLSPQIPSNKN